MSIQVKHRDSDFEVVQVSAEDPLAKVFVPGACGVFASQQIRRCVAEGLVVSTGCELEPTQIQPNSLDLRLGQLGYRIQCSFLPGAEGMAAKLRQFRWYDFPLPEQGVLLERNQVYLFPLCESLKLPPTVAARGNPKSTTGRLDIFTRLVTENATSFDDVPLGYNGLLYLEVVPRSFAVLVRPGDSLAQLRFQVGDPVIPDQELANLLAENDIVLCSDGRRLDRRHLRISNGVFLSVQATAKTERTIGYRARRNTPPIDYRARDVRIRRYWEHIYSRQNKPLILEPDEFYIFASKELLRLPPNICAEMVPFEAGSGELRTHYAGFFDSGFGFAQESISWDSASVAVLEVRNRDVPFLLEDGHPLFRLVFLRNLQAPDVLYGSQLSSNYQGQRLRLAKQFTTSPDTDGAAQRQATLFSTVGQTPHPRATTRVP
jgi:dCTP deaminase